MDILFTESHKILVNSIHIYHTYERKQDREMEGIFDASSNLSLSQVQIERNEN